MTCFSYFSTLLGVTVYVHRWYDFAVKCACGDRYLHNAHKITDIHHK